MLVDLYREEEEEAGMMNISVEKLHARSIIGDVLMSHKPMIVKKGHTIEMNIAEDMYQSEVVKLAFRLKSLSLF